MSKPEQVPSVGVVVHYVLGDEAGLRKGLVRPAIIIATRPYEAVNLIALCDGPNDAGAHKRNGSPVEGEGGCRGAEEGR